MIRWLGHSLRAFLVLAMLLGVADSAEAAWTAPQKLLSTGGTNLKTASDGSGAIVWVERPTAGSNDAVLWAVHRSASGQWSPPEAITPSTPVAAMSFVADRDGRVTVAWLRPVSQTDTELVVSSRVPDGGWTAPEILVAPPRGLVGSGKAQIPAMAITPSGTVAVAWSELGGDLAVATKPRDGTWDIQRWNTGSGYRYAPRLSASADGRIVVVRDTFTIANPRSDDLAQAQVVSRAPNGDWSPLETVTGPKQNADTVIVGAAAGINDTVTVLWLYVAANDSPDRGFEKLQYRSRTANGTWTPLADLSWWMSTSNTALGLSLKIVASASGTTHAVWQNGNRPFAGPIDAWVETASQSNATGAWGSPRQISSLEHSVVTPSLAVSSSGVPVVAWQTGAWSGWPGTLNPVPWNTHPWSRATPSLAFVDNSAVLAVYARGCSPPADPCDHGVEVASTGGPEEPPPPVVTPPPTRIVSLGDSYSSGQGLVSGSGFRYQCGSDIPHNLYYDDTTLVRTGGEAWRSDDCDTRTGSNQRPADLFDRPLVWQENMCHRGDWAYPVSIRKKLGVTDANASFLACSGAVTDDILTSAQYPDSPANVAGSLRQLGAAREWRDQHGNPDMVTVGIGGNDAGFPDIIFKCLTTACADDTAYKSEVLRKINGPVFESLVTTFKILKSSFTPATVVAFGYPSIIGDPAIDCADVHAGGLNIEESERRWLKTQVFTALNRAVLNAAIEAGIAYADISAATEGHELCAGNTAERHMNGLAFGANPSGLVLPESFHPNQRGHVAIANYFVNRYVADDGSILLGNHDPVTVIRPPVAPRTAYLGHATAEPIDECVADCRRPVCAQGCTLHIQGTGYAPNSTLDLTLHSDPVALRDIAVDANGNFSVDRILPVDVTPGTHFLELSGTAPDGLPQYGTEIVNVLAKPGGPSPPTHPPPDAFAPQVVPPRARLSLQVGGARSQRLRSRAIKLTCKTNLAGYCAARATIRFGKRRYTARASARTRAAKTTKIAVRFSPAAARAISHAARRRNIMVAVLVSAQSEQQQAVTKWRVIISR